MSIRTLPHPDNPIHLLRALLRECTYLPDPASRPLLTRYILSRFRDYHPPKEGHDATATTTTKEKSKYPPSPERKAKIITAARRGLSQLIRANDGEIKPLMKVLLFTYGRLGKRRRELMDHLTRPDGRGWRVPKLDRATNLQAWPAMSGRLAALIRSQAKQQLPRLERTVLKTDRPDIPRHNVWMRPLPKKREKNLRWAFYGKTLDRVMPPLSGEEWSRLRDLANGTEKWDGPVPRRSRLDVEEGRVGLLSEHLFGAPLDRQRYRLAENEPHRLTARFMRRLWGRVFIQCPRMRWEGKDKGWEVDWGNDMLESKKIRTANMEETLSWFGDLEDEPAVGRPLSQRDEEDSSTPDLSILSSPPEGSRPLLPPDSTLI